MALACLASILLLFLIEITGRRDSPYIGIFAWVIIPAILVCSLIAVGIGVVRERRRQDVLLMELWPIPASISTILGGENSFLFFS